MGDAMFNEKELRDLLHKMCDARLDAAGSVRLGQVLAASNTARQQYAEYIDLCIGIAYATLSENEGEFPVAPLRRGSALLADDRSIPDYPSTDATIQWAMTNKLRDQGVDRHKAQAVWRTVGAGLRGMLQVPWSARAAVLLVAVGALWMAISRFALHMPQANNTPAPQVASSVPDYAARILRISDDAQWQDPGAKLDFLFRIPANEPVRLASGLVQLEFFSGAVVILHAPAVFTPTGPDSGRLDQGRLIGKVSNGNFRLTTKAAEVIDLGTEFGVSVNGETGTDVLVFDGEVRVVPHKTSSGTCEALNMTEGMAARIRPDGTAEYDFPSQQEEFARSLSPVREMSDEEELSLVDIICSGNGLDTYLSGAIDPLSGQPDSGVWRKSYGAGRRDGDGLFHSVPKHPPIDGVFVPPKDGRGVQLDSLGSVVDLPPNCGQTAGPIWARRPVSGVEARTAAIDFWGTGTLEGILERLQSTQYGLLAMQANVGLSLDLQAMRLQQHRNVSAFEATVTNLDNSDQWNPKHLDTSHNTADFRVYVDGVLRYSRLSFRRSDGDARISVPLFPADQRLTLLSSEGEGEIVFDHVVLIDPIFKIDKQARSSATK